MSRVLIIEDDPTHSGPAAEALRRRHEVAVRTSLAEGLRVLDSAQVDVIVLDLGGTGGDGASAVRVVRAAAPLSEVVVWSGWPDDVLIECLDVYGARSVVPKPCGLAALVWAVECAMPTRGTSMHKLRAWAGEMVAALVPSNGAGHVGSTAG